MAKGGSFSGKSSPGLFGGVIAGSTIVCKSEDNSWYCNLTKFFTLFFQFVMFFVVIYFIYMFFYPIFKKWAFSKGK